MEGFVINKDFCSNNKDRSINFKMIFRVLGILFFIEAALFLLCAGVSLIYGEIEYKYFVYALIVNSLIGIAFSVLGRKANSHFNRRDCYIIVTSSWLLFTIFGMLPFYLSGKIDSFTDAFFETLSGVTTTGITVLTDIESLPYGMLFWRSLTQWFGGFAVVFFTLGILPIWGSGSRQLFMFEATDVTHSNKMPHKVGKVLLWVSGIYLTLTAVETILLMVGGMNLFDAVCHSFATVATGGFSTKQDNISYFNSPFIEYVISTFMMLSAVSYTLYFFYIKNWKSRIRTNTELKWFLKSVGIITLLVTLVLFFHTDYGLEESFRKAFFQVASAHSTSGFMSDDYNLWPHFTWLLLAIAMLSGACTGSTGGGLKSLRLSIFYQNIKNQFRQIVNPRSVLAVRINKQPINNQTVSLVYTFIATYLFFILLGWVLLLAFDIGMTESISIVISAISNVGTGFGSFGENYSCSALPDAVKWILSGLMLIGRLELFGVLLIFSTDFWKK